MRIQHATNIAIFVAAAFTICGSGTPDHLPEYSAAAREGSLGGGTGKTAESETVLLSLEPFADKARCETYFALDAPAAGIAILHVRLENRSPSVTWLLRKSQCRLLLSGSDASLSSASTPQSTGSGEALAITGAALMGLGSTPLLMGLGSHQIKHATTVQRNFTEKELPDKTLSPGQVAEGFVYYQMPAKNASFHGTFQVSLVNTRSQENNSLHIPVDYELK